MADKPKLGVDDLAINLLPEEERKELMSPHMYNPFDLPDGVIMHNPFTGEALKYVKGGKPIKAIDFNGDVVMRNPFTSKIMSKFSYKNGDAIKHWIVTDENEWEEVELKK